jgi:hypothetical protein
MSGGPSFAEAFLAGDAEAAAALLAPDVTFHSPLTDYHGRERVAEVLGMVVQVLGPGEVQTVLEGEDETATFFTAKVGDGILEGVVRTKGSSDITLMARPLAVLLPAVEQLRNAAR